MAVPQLDRARGCLLAGAIGDALGSPIEFSTVSEIARRFPQGYHSAPFYGSITDDTQMTLFTAEGLIRARVSGRDTIREVHAANLRWHQTQIASLPASFQSFDGWLITHSDLWSRRAPGLTCLGALNSAGPTPEPAMNDSKGCGGVMRVAPVGLALDEPFNAASAIAGLTHGHITSSISSGAFAYLIARLARRGERLDSAVDAAIEKITPMDGARETLVMLRSARDLAKLGSGSGIPKQLAPGASGGGWIAEEALAIAVFVCLAEPDPIRALYRAVEHDGDSDSTGSIAGNILGALLGSGWLGRDWIDRLELKEVIDRVATDLVISEIDPRSEALMDRYPVQ